MNLFDWDKPALKITKRVRLIELFAGIGAQAKALERLGVPFEHHKAIEIDRFAVASYNAIHGTDFQPMDIVYDTKALSPTVRTFCGGNQEIKIPSNKKMLCG